MAAPIRHTGGMLGRYRLLEQIGAGGMGVVYRAHDERLGRDVAIKLLTPGSIRSVVARHQVRNEAVALSRISHPNIETIFEFDSIDECDFLVVELIPGVSLDELLSRGPLPQTLAVSLTMQMMRGLAAAHEKGIIHRDLKPSNLRLTPDSFLKILDFGIAHIGEEKDEESHDLTTETHSTVLTGTLAYMSPEQLRGAPLDPRSDIYAAGLVLYQMCVGRPPYSETGALLIDAILNRPVPSPVKVNGEVSSRVEAVILKALEKDPKKRYQSAREMLRDLEVLDAAVAAPFASHALQLFGVTLLILIFGLIIGLEHRRIAGWVDRRLHPVPANKYVAVMPFRSMSNDDPAFDQGLAEAVAGRLKEITAAQPVQVVSPRELQAEHVVDVQDARKKLGVNLGLEGTLMQASGSTRVTQTLVDAATRRLLRAANFDSTKADVFTLQDQLVEKAVQMLEIEIHQGLSEHGHGTTSPEAFRLYTRGRGFLQRQTDIEDTERAIAQFAEAINIDPGYAAAHASLGIAYLQKYGLLKDPSLISSTAQQCAKATALDARLGLAYFCLGDLHLTTGEYEQAAADLQQAVEKDSGDDEAYGLLAVAYEHLNKNAQAEETYKRATQALPQYATEYKRLGLFYRNQGRYQEATRAYQQAIHLAPEDVRAWSSLAGVYYFSGEYEKAVEATQHAISVRPSYESYNNLGASYFALRRFPEAIEAFRQSAAMNGHDMRVYGNLGRAYYYSPSQRPLAGPQLMTALAIGAEDLKVNPRDADAHTLSAQYCALLGRRHEALQHLDAALHARPTDGETLYFAAIVHAQLDDKQEAVSWLKKALERGYSPAEIASTVELDSLRAMPEFQQLMSNRGI
ncbi:MAG: protein kinase domain-containing protein [Terriglobales bacterium]